jgi:hypothetical protein
MYQDVEVMSIDSDASSGPGKKIKKNATADLDKFFKPAGHLPGDKQGWRRCILCRCIITVLVHRAKRADVLQGMVMVVTRSIVISSINIQHCEGIWLRTIR